ncbi:MAG: VWA domain-containing protein [Elusimicrobiales bacterium]|nr:VWA domain-containing protein [Elusimicrobiales bacterium]
MGMQDMLGEIRSIDTNVDIVFAVDATGSMEPLIEKVKQLTVSLKDDIEKGLEDKHRKINNLRVKVIAFRDYYVDGDGAMEESDFFILPEEEDDFRDFVSNIRAGGGGDEPESGLEALALALRSDFVQDGDKKRHIIVLFTDASAHPLEKQKDGVPSNYPANMFKNLHEFYNKWGVGQESLGMSSYEEQMSRNAKRLILFAPNVYPWDEIEANFDNTIRKDMDKGNNGRDLKLDDVIALITGSI